jgi:hypothetical protein
MNRPEPLAREVLEAARRSCSQILRLETSWTSGVGYAVRLPVSGTLFRLGEGSFGRLAEAVWAEAPLREFDVMAEGEDLPILCAHLPERLDYSERVKPGQEIRWLAFTAPLQRGQWPRLKPPKG